MAMETAMAATIIDHYNHLHYDTHDGYGSKFTTFFDQEEEEQLLLEALDAELAQELQFQEALRASLIAVNNPPQTAAAAAEESPLPDSPVEVKWEAGESSLRFCEICKERKEDHQVVRNVYENDSCVCFGCINSSATSRNKGKATKKQQHCRKKSGGNSRRSPETAEFQRYQWIPKDSFNRRRASSGDVEEVEDSLEVIKKKLKTAKEEIRVLMDKIQLQHRDSTEAMDFQEQFFKDRIRSILEGNDAAADDDGKEGLEEKIETGECNSPPKSSSSSAGCSSDGEEGVAEPEPQPSTALVDKGIQGGCGRD